MTKQIESFWDKDLQLHYDVCVGIGLIGGQNLKNALSDAESVRLYSKLSNQDKPEEYYLNQYKEYIKKETENNVLFDKMEISNILSSITKNNFDTDTKIFCQSLQAGCKAIHGEYLVPRSLSALFRMRLFKVKNVNAGFALAEMEDKHEFEILSLHNQSGIPGLGTKLMITAISLGGKYLECFGPYLNGYYGSYQFEVYKEIPNIRMRNNVIQTLYRMKLKDGKL
jgi:hypothetical protein